MTSFLSVLSEYFSLLILILFVTCFLVFCQLSDQEDGSSVVTSALKIAVSPHRTVSLPDIETSNFPEKGTVLDNLCLIFQFKYNLNIAEYHEVLKLSGLANLKYNLPLSFACCN